MEIRARVGSPFANKKMGLIPPQILKENVAEGNLSFNVTMGEGRGMRMRMGMGVGEEIGKSEKGRTRE